jgi:hypothetical protein
MTVESGVKWLLRLLAITTIPAFFAAVMPQSWIVDLLRWAEPEVSPGLLVTYLIRCLMALYAFLGIQAVIWSNDVRRYRPVIMNLCICCIIIAIAGLMALFTAVPLSQRTRAFWIIFVDLTEGLAHLTLLALLAYRVPADDHSS